MQTSDFEYTLPQSQIAQFPLPERSASRLLQVGKPANVHGTFTDIKHLLRAGDLLVLNDTRVIKARLFALKDSGGRAEILFERLLTKDEALCQVRVSKPLKPGRELKVGQDVLTAVGRHGQFYKLKCRGSFLDILEKYGELPLPPYIERDEQDPNDAERYQTVFGTQPGAVAAPTAGLHFTNELLAELDELGIASTTITLHVGAGTFQPVRGELEHHEMHVEHYSICAEAAQQINATKAAGGRVVAVGTTVVRALESAMQSNNQAPSAVLLQKQAPTQLFIRSGFEFKVVDVLITNFHLPRSTLLMLVCAFAGYDAVMQSYAEAVTLGYRFFSYGDAMYLQRATVEQLAA